MALQIAAYANSDDVVIFWKLDEAIPDCLGFALERETADSEGQPVRSYVENRTGFASAPGQQGERRPSTEWPFQRFSWTDHKMNVGDRVRYRVVPVLRGEQGDLALDEGQASGWTEQLLLTGDTGHQFSFFFNRGLVISQFMTRYLQRLQEENPGESFDQTLQRFKASLDQHETPIRRFLSGDLRATMIDLLTRAKAQEGHVYAALYELDDEELLTHLEALGQNAHVVLANGSVKKEHGVLDPPSGDQNEDARSRLNAAGVDVRDRMVSPGALGHNKFLVLCDKDEEQTPLAAWTGSTNWTKTGLCTQINNGLLIADGGIARLYRQQWDRLSDAKSGFPSALVNANSAAHKAEIGDCKIDVWFTRTRSGEDMDALQEEIAGAQEAILFLMFMPGPSGLFKTVHDKMRAEPTLYVQGVVSDLPRLDDESSVDVAVVGAGHQKNVSLPVVQPEGVRHPFASWAEEVTRQSFKRNIGFAIVHSKLVVIDPFTRPVVITGSHNFSGSASTKNDENFVIVRGNSNLAKAYAVHVLSVYHHYRWRANVAAKQGAGENPWGGLSDDPHWQNGHLQGLRRREMDFWVR